jgi:isopentenyl diphosphate isomerase/L-lactate dehydrogenase-like FMN-dependent dehydrogenase
MNTQTQVNRPAILAAMRAGTLSETEAEELTAQGIITADMIESINREGQALSRPAQGSTVCHTFRTSSEILLNSFTFKGANLATAFLKARDAVIKNKHPQLLDEKKEASRAAKATLAAFIHETGCDLDADTVVENYCGFGRVWTTPEKKIAAIAEEHGISSERARELSEAGAAAAQDYVQRQRGNLAGIYLGWLADVCTEDAPETADSIAAINACVTDAYRKAGEWTNRAEGILIESAAFEFGVILPKWEDVLPRITKQTIMQRENVQRRIDKQIEAATASYVDAMKELGNDW